MGDRTSSGRSLRRWLPILIIAGLVLSAATVVLVGRDSREPITATAETTPTSPGTVQATEDPPLGIDADAAAVAAALRDATAAWSSHITSVEVTAVLQRPIVSITTDIGSEQTDASDEFSSAVADFLGQLRRPTGLPYTYRIQILSVEGSVIGRLEATDERWDLEIPAPPTDAAELAAWLDVVYGAGSPQPEPWMNRVTSVDRDLSADGYVVVRTDLDPEAYGDQAIAQTLIDAVRTSGATFAPGVRVLFSDGRFEWVGLLSGAPTVGQ